MNHQGVITFHEHRLQRQRAELYAAEKDFVLCEEGSSEALRLLNLTLSLMGQISATERKLQTAKSAPSRQQFNTSSISRVRTVPANADERSGQLDIAF